MDKNIHVIHNKINVIQLLLYVITILYIILLCLLLQHVILSNNGSAPFQNGCEQIMLQIFVLVFICKHVLHFKYIDEIHSLHKQENIDMESTIDTHFRDILLDFLFFIIIGLAYRWTVNFQEPFDIEHKRQIVLRVLAVTIFAKLVNELYFPVKAYFSHRLCERTLVVKAKPNPYTIQITWRKLENMIG